MAQGDGGWGTVPPPPVSARAARNVASGSGSATTMSGNAAGGKGAEFRAGQVLAQTFRTLLARPGTFLLISLCATVVQWMVTTMGWVAASVLTGFNFVLAALMLSYGAFRTMRGRDVSFGDILRQVGRRAMALLGLGALGTAVAAIVGLVVIGVWGPLAGIPLFVAMLLIFVLAMIAQTMLSVSVLACVVEQLGPMAGMARSFGLTRGYRWQLSGILLAAVVIGLVTGALVVVIVLGLLMGVLEAGRFGEVGGFMMFRFGLSVCGFLWMLLYGAFGGVLVAAIYANLRRAREGDGVDEEVAGVFA